MDPDIIEIPPPVFQTPTRHKQKQVFHEVIDLDEGEVSADVIAVDEIAKTGNKGKAIKNDSDGSGSYQHKHFNVVDDVMDNVVDDVMGVQDHAMLQAYFDSVDIPAGVEAPVPWLADPSLRKEKTVIGSDPIYVEPASEISSSSPRTVDVLGHSAKKDFSSSLAHPQSAHSKNVAHFHKVQKNTAASQSAGSTAALPFYGTLPIPQWVGEKSKSNVGPLMPWWHESLKAELNPTFANNTNHLSFYDPFDNEDMPPEEPIDTPSGEDCCRNKESLDGDDVLMRFKLFKQFDAVEDHSDHYYASNVSSLEQPSNKLVKRIQEEWKILENDLPDTIFVRVYESRMDLLRAVIVGAEGTPYHDGLFFFDVFFPSDYPNVPPNVHYHSGGLRLNPNLYNCGKVCLSLLNTWDGDKNEKWIPSMSTMLQVLVSIQALILNERPYFNEPGWESMDSMEEGERQSNMYNERAFILSLKTMLYTVRRPPKHFNDFVSGHFYQRAHDILAACKAYMDGAEVGSLVKGGVQKIHKGKKSCSPDFKASIAGHCDLLIKEFTYIGVKDCENFLTQAKAEVPGVGNEPESGNEPGSGNRGFHS